MAESEEAKIIGRLSNLIREKGQLLPPENDNDETDRYGLDLGLLTQDTKYAGIAIAVFQALDEYTNRIYLAKPHNLWTPALIDVRENTFTGITYPKGSPDMLRSLFEVFKVALEAMEAELEEIDIERDKKGFSIKDGQGTHKL